MKRYLPSPLVIILFLSSVGLLMRFYNITWGAPYYFHPDERNIASAINQLSFPSQMNPHFFAYGAFPIYLIYFIGVIVNFFRGVPALSVSFEEAIIIGRIFSALLSVGLIPLTYLIGKKLQNTSVGLFAAIFTTTSIGLIQYAHFSTFELWLTFFCTLLFYYCLLFIRHKTITLAITIGLVFGILMSIKVSSSVLLIPLCIFFIKTSYYKENLLKSVKTFFYFYSISLLSALCVFFLTNPFVLLTPQEFLSSMQYESSVVMGTLPVFYIQGFFNTIPIIYQFFHIFPFVLNPFLLFLFLPSLGYVIYKCITDHSFSFFLLILFLLTLFCSQAFFYAKWTRYMIPTLPFIYLIIAITLSNFSSYKKVPSASLSFTALLGGIIAVCFFYSFCFVYVVYYQKDPREQAADWAKNHIPPNAKILSEVYDLGIVPFNEAHGTIQLFNFYDLDETTTEQPALTDSLTDTSFLVLPSQRILKPRLLYPSRFPKGHIFYTNLFSEKGYKKIYETPCDIWCRIIYRGDPIFAFEETANVFDRPPITIFKKL